MIKQFSPYFSAINFDFRNFKNLHEFYKLKKMINTKLYMG